MRLPTFIIDNIDRIIAEWKGAVLPSASPLEGQAKQILMAVAADIESGTVSSSSSAVVTVRTILRNVPDFKLEQVGEALRALRGVVPALWKPEGANAYRELRQFHEAIDFAAGEAMSQHVLQVERTRSLFLGMLGHDLRTPLSAVRMACQYITRNDVSEERKAEAIDRINRCVDTMEGMIRDVLDFARSRLGKNMSIMKKPLDTGIACHEALADVRAAHPRCDFRFEATGNLEAAADLERLRQALHSLLDSAARNGMRGKPIVFTACGTGNDILFRVQCKAPPMSEDTLRTRFDPLAQLAIVGASADGNPPADLGLELFIAREILRVHGGDVGISSGEGATIFEARLPKA